jgi:hypothetical protein
MIEGKSSHKSVDAFAASLVARLSRKGNGAVAGQ